MEDAMNKFFSRNFHLALLGLVAGVAGLFTHRISGGEFVTLALGINGSFRAGDVIVNWLTTKKGAAQ